MKLTIGIESFEEHRKRAIARSHLLDQKVKIEPEFRLTFESVEDFVRFIPGTLDECVTELSEEQQQTLNRVVNETIDRIFEGGAQWTRMII